LFPELRRKQPSAIVVDNVGMLNEDLTMLCWRGWPLLAVFALAAAACTKQNPRSCADGVCNDIAFPFCDVDGSLEGEPNTCIPVACTPNTFEACRGDEVVTCNAMGNNFDVTRCERGCDAASAGCNDCQTNDQCANPAPVCDSTTNACRACTNDDECASQVCNADGSCAPEASVVYAAPTGAPTGSCTQAAPCTLARAVTVATTAAVTPILRLLPGTYLDALSIAKATIGTGAELMSGVGVGGGANVSIRNLSALSLSCSDPVTNTTVSVRDSAFSSSNTVSAQRCTMTLTRVDVTSTGSTTAFSLTGPVDFQADRVTARVDTFAFFSAFGQGVSSRVTNSVFENIYVNPNTSDTTDPGSQILFAFDTFIMGEGVQHDCFVDSGTAHRTIRFENSIMKGTGSTEVVAGTACTFLHNIMTPQATLPPTNSGADPQLANIAARDYHLKSGSPAIDAAVPSTGLDPLGDFDGIARPQGAKKDLGAFEFKP
jgi:hypothetical protein